MITSLAKKTFPRFFSQPAALCGVGLFLLLTVVLGAGPLISPYAYDELHLASKNLPPCATFWLGTDQLGRDLFVRLCYGARLSFAIAAATAFIDLFLGLMIGSLAGFASKGFEEGLMRLLDIFYSIPTLLGAILLSLVFGSGFLSIVIAVNLTGWITMARVVRSEISLLKELPFITAAQALGAKKLYLFFRHLLPNLWSSIFVTLTMTIPAAIFSEAFLSFLGLGIQAPLASWGTMAYEGLPALQYFPWRLLFPAACISLTMLSFYLMGRALSHEASAYRRL